MHSNECDRCCAVMPSLEQLLLWRLHRFPHNCFSFYISPVNKLHLLHPATRTLAHTYTHTHPSRQSRKLTFTLQQFTKGHEGPSFKSIHLIWMVSVYKVSLRCLCEVQSVQRCYVFSITFFFFFARLTGGATCSLALYFLCNIYWYLKLVLKLEYIHLWSKQLLFTVLSLIFMVSTSECFLFSYSHIQF